MKKNTCFCLSSACLYTSNDLQQYSSRSKEFLTLHTFAVENFLTLSYLYWRMSTYSLERCPSPGDESFAAQAWSHELGLLEPMWNPGMKAYKRNHNTGGQRQGDHRASRAKKLVGSVRNNVSKIRWKTSEKEIEHRPQAPTYKASMHIYNICNTHIWTHVTNTHTQIHVTTAHT